MSLTKSPLLPVFLILSGSAQSEVILQDRFAPTEAGGAPTLLDDGAGPFGYELDLTADFSAAGHDKLVLVYSSKDELGGDFGGAPVTKVTYGGATLSEAFFSAEDFDRVTVGIYYLDRVRNDGVLRIELSDGNQSEYGFGLYALDGLASGVQNVASGRGGFVEAATVTVTTDTGFVVQEAARNNQSLEGDPDDGYETLYNLSAQSYRGLSQYQITSEPGDYFAPINNSGVNFRLVAGAAFEGGSPGPSRDLAITSFTRTGENLWEVNITGDANTNYEFYSSPVLNFPTGTRIENLGQANAQDPGTVSGDNSDILTTDDNGNGRVQMFLGGNAKHFLRAAEVAR